MLDKNIGVKRTKSAGLVGLIYVVESGKASPIRWYLKEVKKQHKGLLEKSVPGGRKSKCKGPEVGVCAAVWEQQGVPCGWSGVSTGGLGGDAFREETGMIQGLVSCYMDFGFCSE